MTKHNVRPEIEIVWSRKARFRLREIERYVAADKPEAAAHLTARIVSVVSALSKFPYMGRVGAEAGTRELVVGGTPYVVVYEVERRRVIVHTVWHGAQNREIHS